MSADRRLSAKGLLGLLAVFLPLLLAAPPASAAVVINEVESSAPGDGPDFIELFNTGPGVENISGYYLKDSSDRTFQVPFGTSLSSGDFYVANVSDAGIPGNFGLGDNDQARVFLSNNVTPVDSYSWTSAADTTYGRCPDGSAGLVVTSVGTSGGTNDCSTLAAWPGGASVAGADTGVLGQDVSGLAFEPSGSSAPGVLYAVKNDSGKLFRLIRSGANWIPDPANGWAAGKTLTYPSSAPNFPGIPDAEGVTINADDPNAVYVSTERDSSGGGGTLPAVLRFSTTGASTTLEATNYWNLSGDLPAFPDNGSLESIAWVPDSVLAAKGFHDDVINGDYAPSGYLGHGTGLFFVGAELTGTIYAYALNLSSNAFTKVATFPSGFPTVADLEYEPETQRLWAECDLNCSGRVNALEIAQSGGNDGKFVPAGTYERPAGMPNLNNEGFAIAPQAECADGSKPVVWADDDATAGVVLRQGTISCTALPTSPPTPPATPDTDGDGVLDPVDGCPTVAGPAPNNGCPEKATPPDDDNRACDAAKSKLEKAKAKLKKMKKADAARKKIKSAKTKVKKAKEKVKKVC